MVLGTNRMTEDLRVNREYGIASISDWKQWIGFIDCLMLWGGTYLGYEVESEKNQCNQKQFTPNYVSAM
jgi:hypothetical protein